MFIPLQNNSNQNISNISNKIKSLVYEYSNLTLGLIFYFLLKVLETRHFEDTEFLKLSSSLRHKLGMLFFKKKRNIIEDKRVKIFQRKRNQNGRVLLDSI